MAVIALLYELLYQGNLIPVPNKLGDYRLVKSVARNLNFERGHFPLAPLAEFSAEIERRGSLVRVHCPRYVTCHPCIF